MSATSPSATVFSLNYDFHNGNGNNGNVWGAAVPYADFADPQSLNLYTYVRNIPTTRFDTDGHEDAISKARRRAVKEAWKQERALVTAGKDGTVKWTDAQKSELLKTGKVKGFEGHHINSVNGNSALAGDPNNIQFVEGRAGNLAEHGGSFKNITKGPLLNRSLDAANKVATAVAVGIAVYNVATAPEGQKVNTAVKEGRGIGGAVAGGELGALLGSELGPAGTVVGGLVGSIAGSEAGRKILDPHGPPISLTD